MVLIASVLPAKRKGFFLVRLENGKMLVVSTAGLARFRLTEGQKLTEPKLRQISVYTDRQVLYERAFRFISYRPRSEKEVRRRLREKAAIDPVLLEQTIKKLKEEKLIDDEVFGRWWCEQRNRFRPRGQREVYLELLQKGIAKKLALRLVGENIDEQTALRRLAEKKLRHSGHSPREIQKVKKYLSRKGFSWDEINRFFANEGPA